MTSSSYKMQDSAGTHHLLDSHFACFMYRSECQSKGVLHKHEVFIISDNIDMKEKEVQEKIFKKLEILRENNDEKVRKNIIRRSCGKLLLPFQKRSHEFHKKISIFEKKCADKTTSSSQMHWMHWPNCKNSQFGDLKKIQILHKLCCQDHICVQVNTLDQLHFQQLLFWMSCHKSQKHTNYCKFLVSTLVTM